MNKYFILLLGILLTGLSYAQNQTTPKSTFIVKVGNKEYTVNEGEELKVDSTVVSVKLADYIKFDNKAISFNYPNNFGFEFEKSIGYKNWTLDGNDFVIMYFEINGKTELNTLVNGMLSQFGEENCTTEKIKRKLGNKVLTGKKINISLIGQRLTIDFFEIKMGDSKSRFIAFQDTLDDNGNSSEESKRTFKMIDKTIKYEDL